MTEPSMTPLIIGGVLLVFSISVHVWAYVQSGHQSLRYRTTKFAYIGLGLLIIALPLRFIDVVSIDELYQCGLAALLSAACVYQAVRRDFPTKA